MKNKLKVFMGLILFNLFLILTSTFCLTGCNTTDPPINKAELLLKLEDVSCTEAWITLTINNLQLPAEINLTRTDANGSSKEEIFFVSTADSLLYVDSLLPNKVYKIQVSSILQPVTSNELSVTTMDTTSHNFTWQTFTFGGGGSFINDVTIINENDIWAVGEIYLPDSLGNPEPNLYNVIHWDGDNWTPKRISVEFRGNIITLPLEGAFSFSNTDIWFVGSLPIHGDGVNWRVFDIRTTTDPNLSVSKAWGTSSSDIYFVGEVGSIAYYNGQNFSKIESGTTTIINDVWGIVINNIETIAYCPVSSFFTPGDKKILRIKNNQVDSVSWNMNRLLYSVWTNSERYLFVCGSGAFENKKGYWEEINLPPISINRIRGNGLNDILIVGDLGFVAHFNGFSWQIYNDIYDAGYGSLFIKENIVAITGQRNGKGIITIGKRN